MIRDCPNAAHYSGPGDNKPRPHIPMRIYVVTRRDINVDASKLEEVGVITGISLYILCIYFSMNDRIGINNTIVLYYY